MLVNHWWEQNRYQDLGPPSGWDLTLEAVVEFSPAAEQQVDPGAEGGVGGEVQGGVSTLGLRPHPSQQLLRKEKTPSLLILLSGRTFFVVVPPNFLVLVRVFCTRAAVPAVAVAP